MCQPILEGLGIEASGLRPSVLWGLGVGSWANRPDSAGVRRGGPQGGPRRTPEPPWSLACGPVPQTVNQSLKTSKADRAKRRSLQPPSPHGSAGGTTGASTPKPSWVGRRYDGRLNPQALIGRPEVRRLPQPWGLRPQGPAIGDDQRVAAGIREVDSSVGQVVDPECDPRSVSEFPA